MGCGCGGGKRFSGGATTRRAVAPAPVSSGQATGRVILSQDVKAKSPGGAVPLVKRTTV